MSTGKKFSDTSASRYSLALYELAHESNFVDEVENHSIAILKLISQNKDFNSLIKDPTNKQNDLFLVISKLSENGSKMVTKLFQNGPKLAPKPKRFQNGSKTIPGWS